MARKRVAFSVSGRLGSLPYLCNPIQKNQYILDEGSDDSFVRWCVANRDEMIRNFRFDIKAAQQVMKDGLFGGKQEIEAYDAGDAPWCITYTFMPDEFERILSGYGVKNIKLSGPGAFGRTIPREILVKLMSDEEQKKDFLDFCYQYDSNPYVCGMGKDNLLAVGEI
ncbi:MAG: methyltransferase type 11, partial [Oscillospiraceae bacterium]|nr:methyltransferase type 11 [Oscillospiraceae bacterium]